ncbi:hypothetical protein ABPG73_013419 [Tetrahymena malaccensis]
MSNQQIKQANIQNDNFLVNSFPLAKTLKNISNSAKGSNLNEERVQNFSQYALNQLRNQEEEEVEDGEEDDQNENSSTKRQQDLETIQIKVAEITKKFKIRRVAQKLINSIRSRMLKNMSSLQYNFLNDKCQDFSDIKNKKSSNSFQKFNRKLPLSKFFKQIRKAIDQLPVINPMSISKKIWDTLIAIVLLYSFFIIPIMVSFGLGEEMVLLNYSIEIILFFNVLDIFIHINTGFYEHGILCKFSEFLYQNSWITKNQLINESWQIQYLNSFYFCTVTMSTVGYGDIVPVTSIEIIVCILMMLFASGVFGFSITTINGILEQFFKNKHEILQKMFIIKNYLQKKQINQILQRDITEYLEYIWKQDQNNYSEEENKMIQLLPHYLKNQLYEESNKFLLKQSPILHRNFSEDLLKAIVPIIQEKNYTPNELIIQNNEENLESCLYFIQQGQVEIFLQLQDSEIPDHNFKKNTSYKQIKILNKGEYFGEIEFFTDKRPQTNVKSIGFTTLLILNRNEFIKILQKYPQDLEQYCQIRDKILYNNDFSKIFHKCYSCSSQKHTIIDCPYIHFTYNIHKIIALHNKSENNVNMPTAQERVVRSSYKCKLQYQDLLQVIQVFYEENEDSICEYNEQYLQFSISQCDLCSNIIINEEKKMNTLQKENQKPVQIQLSYSSINQSLENLNGIHNSQSINNKKNQLFISRTYSKQISQNSDDQYLAKKKQQNQKIEIIEYDSQNKQQNNNNLIPKALKNPNNDSNNLPLTCPLNQKLNSSLKVVSLSNIGTTDLEQQNDQNIGISISQNYPIINQHNQNILSPKNQIKQKLLSVQNIKLNKIQSFYSQHLQIQHFDIFQGAFERQKCFDFYFPLSNFEYVIKQIHLNSEQKKKMEKKILEKQKLKFIEIFNKKKLTINTVNSFRKSLKYRSSIRLQDSQKNGRSSLFSQSNTIVFSMNPSQQIQTVQSPTTLQKQSKSKSNFEQKTANQSFDKFEENEAQNVNFQNQQEKKNVDSYFFGNEDFQNNQDFTNQLSQHFNQLSIKSKQGIQNFDFSESYDNQSKDQYFDIYQNYAYSPQNILNQKKDEDYVNSSPMIESQILKFNFSQIPCIEVFKYNSQQENQNS